MSLGDNRTCFSSIKDNKRFLSLIGVFFSISAHPFDCFFFHFLPKKLLSLVNYRKFCVILCHLILVCYAASFDRIHSKVRLKISYIFVN